MDLSPFLRGLGHGGREVELRGAVALVDDDLHTVADFAADDALRELVLDLALDRPLERSRAVRRNLA